MSSIDVLKELINDYACELESDQIESLSEAIGALERVESIYKFIADRHEVLTKRLLDTDGKSVQTMQDKWSETKGLLLFIESLYNNDKTNN